MPVGLVFTNREKFRSDLCMRYCEPIVVTKETLKSHPDLYSAARDITDKLSHALEQVRERGQRPLEAWRSGIVCRRDHAGHALHARAPLSLRAAYGESLCCATRECHS